ADLAQNKVGSCFVVNLLGGGGEKGAWTVTSEAEEGNQREKGMPCRFVGNTPPVNDVHPYGAYSVPKKTSEHLLEMINNDQIERKSIPALKRSHLWDYHHEIYKISDYSNDVNGETKETQPVFLGDESREIKKQITGMRRLLNDSTGRIYQRVGKEGEKLKEEPQDLDLGWAQRLNPPAESQASLHPSQSGAWNELSPQTSHFSGQYGTRSKTFQNQTRTMASNGEIPMVNSSVGPNCCTCNCQSTLQAILQELKTMRKLMQIQAAGTQNRQQPPVPLICAQKSTISRKRNKKKKLPLKTVEPIAMNKKPNAAENEKKLSANSERSSLQAVEPPQKPETPVSGFGIILESASSDPEVQLAEGFDVFMPKSQLDSILSNYTRSGSLLFRKLVCAFFDDKTLANSLPNGKRKRGLNDNRKGLDQNIVGAIKVFTEKYCTANHVDKLPGPRDWVQILQDQIKLARRRLKRGS
ncbi:BEN domain-containing protein 7, partial [Antrostomus carolinensis]|uniref:BEN domain-containing protein 7 n=1 Tax=Antrostomus carolinensis TaxID=279965 RepID=UPI0010A9821F